MTVTSRAAEQSGCGANPDTTQRAQLRMQIPGGAGSAPTILFFLQNPSGSSSMEPWMELWSCGAVELWPRFRIRFREITSRYGKASTFYIE